MNEESSLARVVWEFVDDLDRFIKMAGSSRGAVALALF
jgi:hypothetical protein